ncbi:DMT family transporter [Paracoccus sp. 1_MG-2023]|uniref:DMT family transporter n=1 Tax=unclassified Paracoccus (in: a-proteobacteria) TaxID=2688777 RepID=UPI001C07F20C|nr:MULTISPECIES: DMT family transporter [unclassified Paracoccus (in: a-proteobacteria)]MBU2956675.1 DMT family transporter [Paracoccus sp. C2R09]MDO6668780.1 DMT family transporter [Paracoccus sp. 1_MG-2023]
MSADSNARAALLMVASMALFAVEDAFIKLLGAGMGVGLLLILTGLPGAAIFWVRLRLRGQRMFTRDIRRPVVLLRTLGEIVGAVGFVTALARGDLAATAAILQVLPLALVMGGALFLGETVGWRRWLSVILGFAGVMLILRPGTQSFDPVLLWAVAGVFGLALRDLATRLVPRELPSDVLSGAAYGAIVPAGAALMLVGGEIAAMPSAVEWAYVAGTVVFGVSGYGVMVAALRMGEASMVAPFRYARLAFALIIAALLFGERPDGLTLAGSALIAGAGAYAMWREARLRGGRSAIGGLMRASRRRDRR